VDSAIEVRYAGVTVGRATHVRSWTDAGAFIGFAEPLPTGTRVELRGDGGPRAASVEDVIESADPAVAGMRVRFLADGTPAVVAPESSVSAAEPSSSGAEPSEAHGAEPGDSGSNAGAGGGKRRRRRR